MMEKPGSVDCAVKKGEDARKDFIKSVKKWFLRPLFMVSVKRDLCVSTLPLVEVEESPADEDC